MDVDLYPVESGGLGLKPTRALVISWEAENELVVDDEDVAVLALTFEDGRPYDEVRAFVTDAGHIVRRWHLQDDRRACQPRFAAVIDTPSTTITWPRPISAAWLHVTTVSPVVCGGGGASMRRRGRATPSPIKLRDPWCQA